VVAFLIVAQIMPLHKITQSDAVSNNACGNGNNVLINVVFFLNFNESLQFAG
jgi:hypothetical protein